MRIRKVLITVLVLAAGSVSGCRRTARVADRPLDRNSPEVGELGRIAWDRTAKGPAGENFTEVYEHFFAPMRTGRIRILEIGIASGGSLTTWRDYFPGAQVFGIDIENRSSMDSDRIHTFVADQSRREQLGAFLAKFAGPYDILIDDGGHTMEQQQISLGYLFRHVRPGGYYVVEDVHTSLPRFHSGYGVSVFGGNSTLRVLETFVRTGLVESRYMSREEAQYLTEQIEFCNLFFRNNGDHAITCILRKRLSP